MLTFIIFVSVYALFKYEKRRLTELNLFAFLFFLIFQSVKMFSV